MHTIRTRALAAAAGLIVALAGAAAAQGEDPVASTQTDAASALFACRTIPAEAERLAGFDREVGALAEARANDRVVIVDRAEIRKARRDLFGFPLPRIGLFGPEGESGSDQADRLEATLARFGFDPSGRAVITLENGARWLQIDNQAVLGEPRPGDLVVIESAALGSYTARIAGRRAIRVRRLS